MSDSTLSPASSPPPANSAPNSEAAMSTPETLANIFFEPGRTFAALRERPRFLVAGLIILVLSTLLTVLVMRKVDFTQFMREQIERSPNAGQMSPEQREQAVRFWTGPIGSAIIYASPVIGTPIYIAGGAALYLLGVMLMGGAIRYKQALAVWVYSWLPPAVLGTLIGIVVLFLKSPEDIDLNQAGGGLVTSNLGFLLSSSANPVLKALFGSIDLLAFYGLYLAAVGLQKVARLKAGAAWMVVAGLYILRVVLRIGWAIATGN